MDNLIHLLPDPIANQIAAGEVIQRPASVIKELVENSVDAGATKIDIEIKDAGKTLIRVTDDGKGMDPMDARMAFERHATSKIREAADLFALTTMGFRGEALPSIAAVSQVILQTRTPDAQIGTRVELEGSKFISQEQVMCATGSSFSIKNLFFNVPARRKFLKSDDTEFRHIITEVQRIAAVHPDIAFTLRHGDSTTLKLSPTTLKQRIVDIFGNRLLQSLLPIDSHTPLVDIHGFVSSAGSSRKRGAQQYFFVNDRFMKHPYFHRTVMNAYESLITAGEQPEYFIFLKVDPSTIDVNIHPTKTEIKFEAESEIGRLLYTVLRESLMKGASVPSIEFDREQLVDIPTFTPLQGKEMTDLPIISPPSESPEYDITLPNTDIPSEYRLPDITDWDSFYSSFEANRSTQPEHQVRHRSSSLNFGKSATPDSASQTTQLLHSSLTFDTPKDTSSALVIGEYAILAEGEGILVVHILRAKMKVWYEEYRQSLTLSRLLPNRLLFPELIELTVQEEILLHRHREVLKRIGFDISDMGARSYAINAIPEGFASGAEGELLLELLHECDESERESEEILQDRILLTLTRRRLRQESETSTRVEVVRLVHALQRYSPHTHTPDGKLILSVITPQELRKRFGS